MNVVRLNRTSRILAGHLWVFSNELATSPKNFEPGSLVELIDRKEQFLGIGYINPHSLIAIRILTRDKEEITPEFFSKRILRAVEYRRGFLSDRDSFRVVFSEGDFLPGLIVDKYGDCLVAQFLTAGIEKWREAILDILEKIFSPSVVVLRNDSATRLLEGLPQEKSVVRGTLKALPIIREASLRFEVDPLSGQKTGFFLDQRENREAFKVLVRGGKGLDLFCYSGAWSIYLADKGAEITGVDESEYAVNQSRRNAAINGLAGKCTFKAAEVFAFVKEEVSCGNLYDFIVLDPPAFVKSRTKVREAMKAYRMVNAYAMRLLNKGGFLATSSCSYHVDKASFVDMLRTAARDVGRQARIIEMRSQGKDHPVLLSMQETEYLKCAFLIIE